MVEKDGRFLVHSMQFLVRNNQPVGEDNTTHKPFAIFTRFSVRRILFLFSWGSRLSCFSAWLSPRLCPIEKKKIEGKETKLEAGR